MNAKTDRWEVYTDKAGRRHWRWPASDAQSEREAREITLGNPPRAVTPAQQQQAHFAPPPPRGK